MHAHHSKDEQTTLFNYFFRMEKICQKATKATIRKKELDRKAGQNRKATKKARSKSYESYDSKHI